MDPASSASRSAPTAETAWLLADAAIALAVGAARRGSQVVGVVVQMLRPLTDLAARPPLVPQRYWPGHWLRGLADTGCDQRRRAMQAGVDAVVARVESTGSLKSQAAGRSQAAQGARIQSVEADEAIAAWVDRVFGPRR